MIELSIVIIVIGVLISGLTQSGALITKFRISSAQSLTQSSPVSSIKDLYIWYETTSENSFDSGVVDHNDSITKWYDIAPQTTTPLNLTQTTSSLKPTYKTESLNGLPTVYFNSDELDSEHNYRLTGNPDFTIIIVGKIGGSSDWGPFFSSGINATCQLVAITKASSSELFIGYRGNGQTYTYADLGSSAEFAIHTWVRESNNINDSQTGNTVFINGQSKTLSTAAGCVPDVAPAVLTVGYNVPGRYLIGNIAEFIIFSRNLKTKERQDIEKYLSQKWGIDLV